MASSFRQFLKKCDNLIKHTNSEKRKKMYANMKQLYAVQALDRVVNFITSKTKEKIKECGELMRMAAKEWDKKIQEAMNRPASLKPKPKAPDPELTNLQAYSNDLYQTFDDTAWLSDSERENLKKEFSADEIGISLDDAAHQAIEIKETINSEAKPEPTQVKDQWLKSFLAKKEQARLQEKIAKDPEIKQTYEQITQGLDFSQETIEITKNIFNIQNLSKLVKNTNNPNQVQLEELLSKMQADTQKFYNSTPTVKQENREEEVKRPGPTLGK